MKRCPKCNRTYSTVTQKFCTHDGGILVPIDSPQADTIRIDSSTLDAPTKAISRELVDSGKIDPYKTNIGQPFPPKDETTPGPGRITQDLTPIAPPPPPQQQTEPLSPSDSGTLPSLPSPPPVPPAQPTSAPLPPAQPQAPSPQFPAAAQAQRVQPIGAAASQKKSKLPLILGVVAVLLVLGVGGIAAAYFFAVRPMIAKRLNSAPVESRRSPIVTQPSPKVATTPTNVESRNPTPSEEPPPYNPPSDAVQFVNSNQNLNGKLAEHYVDFNFYYPDRWAKDPKAGTPGATNFAKMQRQLSPDAPQEIFSVSLYESTGSEETDRASYPLLVEQKSSQLAKDYPEYHKTSEGPTRVGPYNGYEFRFDGMYRNTDKGDVKIWGRVIFVRPVDGSKNGVTLHMLATSLTPEVKRIDDVGVKGELPMILESFRFGKK